MEDIIRIGKISTVNYAAGTASVIYTDRTVCVTQRCAFILQVYVPFAFLECVTRSMKYTPSAFPIPSIRIFRAAMCFVSPFTNLLSAYAKTTTLQ